MAKQTTTFALALSPRDQATPASRWLCDALRAEIRAGRVRPGARLPATRDLARQYGLSRGTIVRAFEQLCAEGYLETSVGSGTYVKKVLPDTLLHVAREISAPRTATDRNAGPGAAPTGHRARSLSGVAQRVRRFPPLEWRPVRAFRANLPAVDLFPTKLWAQIAARRLRAATAGHLLGTDPLGHPALRAAVTDYLTTARGVKCTPEQVVIVSGFQEALDLVTRLVLNEGDSVCIEDPGYLGAWRVFEAAGATMLPMPVDAEGMTIPGSRLRDVRLAYVTPAHQYPLGISMSLARRRALLDWAWRSGTLLFEDDYDSEFRYSGQPLPAMQGLDERGVVVFCGTFSKVMFPSLRLGYLVVPADLVERVAALKSVTSQHAPVLEQLVLCDFIVDGHFGRHIRRMREVYGERLTTLLEGARQRLTGLLEISSVDAGLQTVGWLPAGMDDEVAAAAAAAQRLDTVPISRFARRDLARQGLVLGFAAVDAEELRRGAVALAAALEKLPRRSHAVP